ncbi:hypothetical protein [Brachyspira aalborgi]|uniref:Uncharacterized protein n=1 Tax=Brachyspira aalborgi TaxID=29522 RepID=A0A5C8G3I0_9SPIR|nr:hypothetical protein [Brachyspira aalborgi]TXJ56451.1 hypothetical protein EPJ76_04875 [Brachyspira aalborgi]
MKNIILIVIIILTFVISCRKSTLEVTEPGASFFLGKMKDGNYGGFEVGNGGNTVKFNGKDYTFDSDIMGIGGIYQDTNSSNYVGVFPIGDSMHTITMDKSEKDALNDIVKVVGKENSGPVIQEILTNNGKLDAEAITKNFPDKKTEVEDIIKQYGLDNKNQFGDYKEYKKN